MDDAAAERGDRIVKVGAFTFSSVSELHAILISNQILDLCLGNTCFSLLRRWPASLCP